MRAKLINEEFKHPEQRENEIFLINVRDHENWENKLPDWIESVRRGFIAYKTRPDDGFEPTYDDVVPDMRPLFGVLKK